MSVQLEHFFKSCDPDGAKLIDREAFRNLCSRLEITVQDADIIFEDLDHDQDGRISFADFSRGFSNFLSTSVDEKSKSLPLEGDFIGKEGSTSFDVDDQVEVAKNHVWAALTTEAEKGDMKYNDENKLRWLLNQLQETEQRHLVPYLEIAVEELLSNLQQLQEEKKHLEESWRREKSEHDRHLKRMEEEMDTQVKEAEIELRVKAQAEVEDERKSLQSKMDAEMDNLQAHLALFEKVNAWLGTQPRDEREVRMNEVRNKLDEAVHENRQLRMSLLDTQTSIAVMRTELLQLRTMYEEKCRELKSEREKVLEALQEQDHLSHQLNLLHDANKRLLDSHDALRCTVENSVKQVNCGTTRKKSGSIIGDYLELGYPYGYLNRLKESEENEEEVEEIEENSKLRRTKSMDVSFPTVTRIKSKDRHKTRSSLNHSDSGVSTFPDPFEDWDTSPRGGTDSDDDQSLRRKYAASKSSRRSSRQSRPLSMPPSNHSISSDILENTDNKDYLGDSNRSTPKLKSSASQDSILENETFPRRRISEIKKQLGLDDSPGSWRKSWSPAKRQSSTPKEGSLNKPNSSPPKPLPRLSVISKGKSTIKDSANQETSAKCNESIQIEKSLEESHYEPTGPAEHTFKVIFVGDAGVGKSSFALRISKGVFVRHMSSTLGVDFLMRTLNVDGQNIAVQLWDTAGQERFRSITKTYFRKADGVMLLYDCTCERSFLNVRQWVEDIDKNALQRIPLMIVANKIDLREAAIKEGKTCISTEKGEQLAKDCDTTFMEASAKEGSNVLDVLANLIRSMVTQQDLQLTASTLQLTEAKSKKSSCCGK